MSKIHTKLGVIGQLVTGLVLAASLAACGDDSTPAATVSTTASAAAATTTPTAVATATMGESTPPSTTSTTSSSSSGSSSSGGSSNSGVSLMSYLLNNPGVASGQTDNIYDSNPLDAYGNTALNSSGSNIVAATTVSGTSEAPAMQNSFAVIGDTAGAGWYDDNEGSSNTGSGYWLNLAKARDAAGIINYIVAIFPNPAGEGNNPWNIASGGQPAILTSGSSVQNQFLAWTDTFAAQLQQLNHGFLLSPMGELNLGGGSLSGNWLSSNISGNSSAYTAAVYALFRNRLIADGVKNFLYVFEFNSYHTPYDFGYNSSIFDVLALDDQPASAVDAGAYAWMTAQPGKLLGYGSFIVDSNPQGANEFSYDMGAQVNDFCAEVYPNFKFAINWSQNTALNVQNNAAGFMSSGAMYGYSKLPSGGFATAGGLAGG